MSEQELKAYPSVKQSVGILFITIACTIFTSPLGFLKVFIGANASTFISYTFAMGISLWIIHILRKEKSGETGFNVSFENLRIIPIILIATIGMQYALSLPLASSIPMPDSINEMFKQLLGDPKNGFTLITIVVAAPILEELIFRGIILDGMLKRYSPAKAIIVSSLLFGIVHLNPWQFLSAMVLGSFIGWVYYRTHNLLFAIIIHAFNNFIAVAPYFFGVSNDSNRSLVETFGGWHILIPVIAAAAIILLFSLNYLNKKLKLIEIHAPGNEAKLLE